MSYASSCRGSGIPEMKDERVLQSYAITQDEVHYVTLPFHSKFSRFLQARFEHNALAYIDDFINDVMLSPPAALATSLWQAGVLPEQSAVRNSSLPDLTVVGP